MLIGCLLRKECSAGLVSGLIVETEAYTGDDPASHSFGGPTKRNRHMYDAGGSVYVYFVYGMHHCMNVVSGQEGDGQAVLIRAVEPLDGIEMMRINRPGRSDAELCSGPGRLCAALGVTMAHDGSVLGDSEFSILVPPDTTSVEVIASGRIGITRARARNWRFRQADSGWVSG